MKIILLDITVSKPILFAFSICLLVLSSCNNNVYKTFYKGEGRSIYFVFPLKFKSVENNKIALIDYTIEDEKESVIVNCTVNSPEFIEINSLKFESGGIKYKLSDIQKILNSRKGKVFSIRYTGSLKVAELKRLIQQENCKFIVNDQFTFECTPKTERELEVVSNEILIFR